MAWHEDDELWAAVEPVLFTASRLAAAPAEVDGIVRLAAIAPGARVLDVGCGHGRHAVELARRGHRVTGIDRTARYVERARAAADAAGVDAEFVCGDARTFVRDGAFDVALSLFTSFGFFDDEGNLRAAENLRRCLAPGGTAVIDVMGAEVLARSFQARDWSEEGGTVLLQERRLARGGARIEARWIVLGPAGRREAHIEQALWTATGLRELLASAGFAEVALYGSLGGAPYDASARRLVAVARAPTSRA
jgi:SAM-dependent methyltransferase